MSRPIKTSGSDLCGHRDIICPAAAGIEKGPVDLPRVGPVPCDRTEGRKAPIRHGETISVIIKVALSVLNLMRGGVVQ